MTTHTDTLRRPAPRGFSLVEMLVVVGLITVLMAITVGGISRLETSHDRTETMSRLRTLARALQVYRDDWGDVPPYNPAGVDLDEDGNPDGHGPGLWSLYMLRYVSDYRFLADPNAPVERPFILAQDGSTRIEVVPGDPASMATAYNEWYGGAVVPTDGSALPPRIEYQVYTLLAQPGAHDAPGTLPTDYGTFAEYDFAAHENYCSWMMQDPYTLEWKYLPVRKTAPPGAEPAPSAGGFPAADTSAPTFYHRQLSHHWTDQDSPRYLPASDTVVTWSHLFREIERRPAYGVDDWGHDLVLFADGHVAVLPGPESADYTEWRAIQRPPRMEEP